MRTGLLIAAVLGAAALLPRAPIDNSVDALLGADDNSAKDYADFRARFGTDEIIIARVEAPDTASLAAVTASIAAILRADAATAHVVDPTTVYADSLAVLTDDVFKDDPDARRNALDATHGPLGERLRLLDLEQHRATVYAFTRSVLPKDREPLAARLDEERNRALNRGVTVRLAGPPLLNLTLDRAGREVASTALPLLVVVCLLVCLVVLRSVRGTIAVFVPVGLTVLGADGLYGLSGETSNLVVDIAKPLLFVLLLAGGLHIVAAYRSSFDGDANTAAERAVHKKGRAAALALITTAIGFGSLALSSIHPIRMFGIFAAAGLLIGLLTVLAIVPAMLVVVWPDPHPMQRDRIAQTAAAMVAIGLRWRAMWIGAAVVVIGAGAWAFTTLETEPHAIRYFPANHPIRADHEALEREGLGLATLEVVVTATSPLDSTASIRALDDLAKQLEAIDGVQSVVGLPLFLREATFRARGIDTLPTAAFRGQILDQKPAMLDQLISKDRRTARLAATITTLDAQRLDDIAETVRRGARPAGASVFVTGSYRLLLDAQRGLLSTLAESLLTTFLLMQLILLVAVRSFRLGLIAIVPNLVPVAMGFVWMKILGIRLDIGTTMTAAIALGIAVDDTLHFLLATKAHGVRGAARVTGQAIVSSSLVVSAGFFVLLTTSFGPTRSFGLLAGAAMVTALLADLLVLPALLGEDKPIKNERP